MLCQRSRGFLVCETFDEQSSDSDSFYTRCINCGDIEDAAVRANHIHRSMRTRAILRGVGRSGSERSCSAGVTHTSLYRSDTQVQWSRIRSSAA